MRLLLDVRPLHSSPAFRRVWVGTALSTVGGQFATALVAAADGAPWVVAGYMIVLCAISLVAFLAVPELKDMDITAAGPAQLAPNQ